MLLSFLKPKSRSKPKGAKTPAYSAPPRDAMTLWYCFPADPDYKGWEEEALPIGNGDMGAKIFGGIDCEQLQLNEKSLWSGSTLGMDGCENGNGNGDWGQSIREIQALLTAENYSLATEKMKQLQGGETGLGAYQNFGSLFCQILCDSKHPPKDYIRDLDLNTAIASVNYKKGDNTYHREYFASYPDQVICGQLTGIAINAAFSFQGAHPGKETVIAEGNTITLTGALQSEGNPLQYCGKIHILTDGKITASGDALSIKEAGCITFFCAMKTDFGFTYPEYREKADPNTWVDEKINAAIQKGYEQVKKDHVKDYQALFNRVQLEIGQKTPCVPTDVLLYHYRKNQNKKAMERLLYHFGRYLLIASSRPGGLPANLQGVWNASNEPAWQSDYHLNINLQMNYFPAMNTNLSETELPLFDYINHCLVVPGRATAAHWTGIGTGDTSNPTGWMAHTQNNLQGHTGPGSDWRWGWDPAAGAFILENSFEYYLFTKDIDLLAEKIYPAMEEHALLWSQLLVEDKKYGRLASSPCYSPEHGPVSIGNTYDQEMVWQLYANVIQGAEDLIKAGKDSIVNQPLITLLKKQIALLKPHQIGKWGQLKEWIEEDDWKRRFTHGEQKRHRHISHLLGLYPGNHITPENKDVIEAAKVSLNDRGDKGQGWSKALKIGAWARLNDGDHAYRILEGLIKNNINWNLWDIHPPYQIDGNFGYTAGVTEMLLQSHGDCIELLPALPACWADNGSFQGLMARGNFEVSCRWEHGKVTAAELISNCGGVVKVKKNGTVTELITEKDGRYTI